MKPLQNKFEYQTKVIHLIQLLWLEKQNFIKIYYGDGTKVSMNSYLPSAWQDKKNPICIIPQKYMGLNVFGFLNHDNDLSVKQFSGIQMYLTYRSEKILRFSSFKKHTPPRRRRGAGGLRSETIFAKSFRSLKNPLVKTIRNLNYTVFQK